MNESNKSMILVVDDVPRNIQIVGNILKQQGYAINFANSGKKAIEHARSKPYDLILLDIMMPEMSGFEVCETLKNNPETQEIPIIFLTAKTDADSITQAFETGGVDYVTKPFNSRELLARVATHIRLRRRELEQKELNATKDKFFSIIAHDLKNPFNTLLGYSELLSRKLKEYPLDKLEELINTIYQSSRKTYDLLENLLIWSRSQTNRVSYNPAPVNAATLLRESTWVHKNTAEDKAIKIQENLDEDLMIHADYNMITLVTRNLVSNAIKFTPEEGRITLEARDNDNNHAIICVHDTGMGIKEENQAKLFTIGEAYSTSGTKQEKGTGLGLILCKEFVQKHEGDIWVNSQPGKGSSFCFTLKKAPKQEPDQSHRKGKLAGKLKSELLNKPEFSAVLTELQATQNDIAKSMNISAIRGFASTAIQYGNTYSIESLTDYGDELQKAANTFDIKGIKELLQLFEQDE